MARAIKQRWPITQARRQGLVDQLVAILDDKDADVRARVSAAKALLQADALNMAQERQDVEAEVLARIEALERELAGADQRRNTPAPGGTGGKGKPKKSRKKTTPEPG